MVVYNVTISLDKSIAIEWTKWMKEVHIPSIMETGHFRDCKLCRVQDVEEEGGMTFAVMYTAKSKEDLDAYHENHAPRLQQEHTAKFSGKFAAFRTMLNVLDEF